MGNEKLADKWAGEKCFLNGKPAKILGRLNRVATIAILPDGPSEQFSWQQVERTMRKHFGNFDAQWS